MGFNRLGILMGDLACTLQNHLNPTLFRAGRRDVNEKLMAFADEIPFARLCFPFEPCSQWVFFNLIFKCDCFTFFI